MTNSGDEPYQIAEDPPIGESDSVANCGFRNSPRASFLWRRLAYAVRRHSILPDKEVTEGFNCAQCRPFRCETLGLIEWHHVGPLEEGDGGPCWWRGTLRSCPSSSLLVTLSTPSVSAQELAGFDNTGSVRVWAGEEALSYWCVLSLVKDMRACRSAVVICELAGGMTCSAGLFAAVALANARGNESSNEPSIRIILTDGNEKCVDNARRIAEKNAPQYSGAGVSVENRVLRFGRTEQMTEELRGKVDVVIAADCLFFDHVHAPLLETIHSLLKPGGSAFLVAPERRGTLHRFIGLAKESHSGFGCSATDLRRVATFEGLIDASAPDCPQLVTLKKVSPSDH